MRPLTRLTAAIVAACLGVLAFAGTAHADHNNGGAFGTGFVDGGDALTDDWGDHYGELGNSLCDGCADSYNTDLVIMWQAILYAEGFLPKSEIDGQFGPITRDATVKWQNRYHSLYGVSADGRVGNQTWSAADNLLHYGESNGVFYRSAYVSGDVNFRRGSRTNSDGAYELQKAFSPDYDETTFYNTSHRINFYSKTISVI